MSHLKETGMGYISHFFRAMYLAWYSFVTSLIFVAHAFVPSAFSKEGSRRVADLNVFLKAGNSNSDRILVRFNTKHAQDELGRNWRVLINGEETLAHQVYINVPVETIVEPIATGEIKYHFLCWGKAKFSEDHIAVIDV